MNAILLYNLKISFSVYFLFFDTCTLYIITTRDILTTIESLAGRDCKGRFMHQLRFYSIENIKTITFFKIMNVLTYFIPVLDHNYDG